MSLRLHNFGGSMRSHLPAAMLASGIHQESDGHALHLPVLVLNASYEPINVCAARRAIVLVLKGVAMTEEENGHFLHAARVAMRVPCRGKTSCCATATPANIAAPRYHPANSRWTT